jgi:hypothetical protein
MNPYVLDHNRRAHFVRLRDYETSAQNDNSTSLKNFAPAAG